MIALSPLEKKTIALILDRRVPGITRAVFGSRAVGKAKKFSDLDLLLDTKRPLSPAIRGMLKEDFSESSLPFRVDVVDAAATDAAFLEMIKNDLVPLD